MATVAETTGAKGDLAAALAAGVTQISRNQEITFTKYNKVVLPIDGLVFWVRADLLAPSAIYNSGGYNRSDLNQGPRIKTAAVVEKVSGSFHYIATATQNEDENYTKNQVIFTATEEVPLFNEIDPLTMFIGQFDDFKFSFSSLGPTYKQADLFHYRGDAVYSFMQTQIIDNVAALDTLSVYASNSLPIWLAMNKIMPIYPSYLVPQDLPPPFATISIDKDSTVALQASPYIDSTSSRWQLVTEKVTVMTYGLRNNVILDYVDYVMAQSLTSGRFGLMNSPVIRDQVKGQNELNIIAQKKSIVFEINYYQQIVRDVAQKLILEAIPTFIVAMRDESIEFDSDVAQIINVTPPPKIAVRYIPQLDTDGGYL